MIKRPRLKPQYAIGLVDDDRAIVIAENSEKIVDGRLLCAVLNNLGNGKSSDDIADALAGDFGAAEVFFGLMELERLGLIEESGGQNSAERVFWIADNGSSHRGQASIDRLSDWYRNAILVHTPIHASWLNQIEIYFSILQRKVLTPNDFDDLSQLKARILAFQDHYQKIAKPFEWKFTREDLKRLLARLSDKETSDTQAA